MIEVRFIAGEWLALDRERAACYTAKTADAALRGFWLWLGSGPALIFTKGAACPNK